MIDVAPSARQDSIQPAQFTVCWIWRANLSAPECTSNTVSPSIPTQQPNARGDLGWQVRLGQRLLELFARFGHQRSVRRYSDGQYCYSFRARDPSILDHRIVRPASQKYKFWPP
jgi:hypothetical protein